MAAGSPWDAVIVKLEKDIATAKVGVLEARASVDELDAVHARRVGELDRFIDHEVDQIAVLQSMLNHARRQRDGDPLVEALEAPPVDETHLGVRGPTPDDYRERE